MQRFLKKLDFRPLVLPFLSMVDRRKNLHRLAVEQPPKEPFPFLRNYIPYASIVEQMGVRREPLPVFAPHSPAAEAFDLLWQEIKARISAGA
jgi:hypothetical protein